MPISGAALSLPDRQTLAQLIGAEVESVRPISGGDHRAAFRIDSARGAVFLKCGPGEAAQSFAAEAAGLQALAAANALRVPKLVARVCLADTACLALEWIDFAAATGNCERRLGEGLAKLHQLTAPHFGWLQDNNIGATRQHNAWHQEWIRFFADQRLGVQLALAQSNGASSRLFDRGVRLCEALHGLFVGHRPQPSLLHGDLWGGNWAADGDDQPVIFDPAVYYGDREADLAMTRLFGGFGPDFYSAYQRAWPLDAGASVRVTLYNLYHVLNHFNLFGGSYQAQALRMTDELLAHLGAT